MADDIQTYIASAIQAKNLNTTGRGLTQAHMVGVPKTGRITPLSGERPQHFVKVHMASFTSDIIYPACSGALNPVQAVRMAMQYARDKNIPFSQFVANFEKVIKAFGFSPMNLLNLHTLVLGNTGKPIRPDNIGKVVPTMVMNKIREILNTIQFKFDIEFYVMLLTDFVCGAWSQMGWILPDSPYDYRIKKGNAFPKFADYVSVMDAHRLYSILTSLADADLSLIKRAMAEGKRNILPSNVATQMANYLVSAYDRVEAAYPSSKMVETIFVILGRIWDLNVPDSVNPTIRIRQIEALEGLKTNLSMFLAYQDMVKISAQRSIHFSDDEIPVIVKLFTEAMATFSPFKERSIADATSFIGRSTVCDHKGNIGYMSLYESWKYPDQIQAFSTVRVDSSGTYRYLEYQPGMSGVLSDAMAPVQQAFSIDNIVRDFLGVKDLQSFELVVPNHGAEISLYMPSMVERDLSLAYESLPVMASIATGSYSYADPKNPSAADKAIAEHVEERMWDYYAMVCALATRGHANVDVAIRTLSRTRGTTTDNYCPRLILQWTARTPLVQPQGKAALVSGMVRAVEPLEVLLYVEDFKPLEPLTSREVDIASCENALQAWDWHKASARIEMELQYATEIKGIPIVLDMKEHEVLGTMAFESKYYFLKPTIGRAAVKLAVDSFLANQAYCAQEAATSNDSLVASAFTSRRITSASEMVTTIIRLGAEGVGAECLSVTDSKIADALWAAGSPEKHSEFHVGIKRADMMLWAGFAALQLLGLLTADEAKTLADHLRTTGAIESAVAFAARLG